MKEPLILAIGTKVKLVPSTASRRQHNQDSTCFVTGCSFNCDGELRYSLNIGAWYARIDLVFLSAPTPESVAEAFLASQDFEDGETPESENVATFYTELEAKLTESIGVRDTVASLTHEANNSSSHFN